MAKQVPNVVTDTLLAKIGTGTRIVVCSAEPANFAGIAAVALASATLTAGSGNGSWLIANGDVSGRKMTCLAKNGVSITTSGTATHIAHDDGTTLLWVTTCNSQALTSGGTVDIPAHKHEVAAVS